MLQCGTLTIRKIKWETNERKEKVKEKGRKNFFLFVRLLLSSFVSLSVIFIIVLFVKNNNKNNFYVSLSFQSP